MTRDRRPVSEEIQRAKGEALAAGLVNALVTSIILSAVGLVLLIIWAVAT
jgi:hypothetical protein